MALYEREPVTSVHNEALTLIPEFVQDGTSSELLEVVNPDGMGDVISLVEARDVVESLFTPAPLAPDTEGDVQIDINPVVIPDDSPGMLPQTKPTNIFSRIKSQLLELKSQPRVGTRPAQREDIETLVDVDIRAFGSVYENYDISPEEWRSELTAKFHGRLDKVTGEWMRVFERDGEIAGFITSCPTRKSPEDFVNWEETTDNGTLETTYDPEGDNVYVVSLSMVPEGSSLKGQNMLFGDQIGKFIAEGYKQAFFESRMPGLGKWVQAQCAERGLEFDGLSSEQKDQFAEEYFGLKTEVKGKEVPYDRLLRIYDAVGCKLIKVVPDAYQDEPSMNYGVVCVFDNPLPEGLRDNKIVSRLAGGSVRLLAKSLWISKKLF